MGSFFAGIKSGTLAGIVYIGGLALFNVGLLYLLKTDVMSAIQAQYPQVCPTGGNSTSIGVEDCFSSVVAVYVPYIAFIGFFVSLLYSGIFGRFYEIFPGGRSSLKGETIAVVVGVNLLALSLTGVYFNFEAEVANSVFLAVWTMVYGFLLGALYKRYTRVVKFETQGEGGIRISVDGKDFTGKTRTFAAKSTHDLRADVADDTSFKEWSVSGGVTVEDARSFETSLDIEGDGLLKAAVSKKY